MADINKTNAAAGQGPAADDPRIKALEGLIEKQAKQISELTDAVKGLEVKSSVKFENKEKPKADLPKVKVGADTYQSKVATVFDPKKQETVDFAKISPKELEGWYKEYPHLFTKI